MAPSPGLYFFDTLVSTSDKVRELLDQGVEPPFAVMAGSQTGGRGRQGRSWISPPGNLYLSLALPPSGHSPGELGLLPLAFGVWISDYVQQKFGLRLTLKWPNDLLFAGAKLGGVLSEAEIADDRVQRLILGIGLNISSAPNPSEVDYQATRLWQHVRDRVGLKEMGETLIGHLWQSLAQESLQQARERYPSYAIGKGQLWQDTDGRSLFDAGLSESGGLKLERGGQKRLLTSSHHEFAWRFQQSPDPSSKTPRAGLGVFDVGNTALKVGYFRNPAEDFELSWQRSYRWAIDGESEKLDELMQFLAQLPDQPEAFYGVSVNPQGNQLCERLAKSLGMQWFLLPKRPVRVRFPVYDFQQLGCDRLALIEAAARRHGSHPLAVMSFGTATTVDVLDTDRYHIGGLILPGLATQLAAIGAEGQLLPVIGEQGLADALDEFKKKGPLGRDTASALCFGQWFQLQQWISGFLEHFELGEHTVYLAGGLAPLVHKLFPGQLLEDGVLKGCREMALGGTDELRSPFLVTI